MSRAGGGNMVYWLTHQLGADELRVLRSVKAGTQGFHEDRFWVAALIAQACVEADNKARTLTITPKGLDGLEHHS